MLGKTKKDINLEIVLRSQIMFTNKDDIIHVSEAQEVKV